MFEQHSDPLLPFSKFLRRMAKHFLAIILLIALSLALGVAGYRLTAGLGWVDAFYNASMILSGMGPAAAMPGDTAKIFASFYALYSGLFVIAVMGILLAPVFHRVVHKFHQKN